MRDAFLVALTDLGHKDRRIRLVTADIGFESVFHRELPDQFLNVGVAEQIMVGMAAGMALRGLRPVCYTIAPFALYRPFEFIRNDICLQRLPVIIVGMGAGDLPYPSLGRTHQANEDLFIAKAIGLTLLTPCDPRETVECLEYAFSLGKPCYLRLGKTGEPDLTEQASPFTPGAGRFLRHGSDHLIIGYGPILGKAKDIDPLATVVSLPTETAFNTTQYKKVTVLEDHQPFIK